MRMFYRAILVGLMLVSTSLLASDTQESPLRFAPIPMASKAHMVQEYLPFLDYLETHTGKQYELAYYASYADLLDGFVADEIDLAYLGPLPYVALTERIGHVSPVVQFLDNIGQKSYTCALVGFADQQALGKHIGKGDAPIALTQPLSTCGYLVMNDELKKRTGLGLESYDYVYTGSHEAVALGVILGQQILGGMKTLIARQYHHLGLRVLGESSHMPGFMLVANEHTVPAAFIQTLIDRLTALDPLHDPIDRDTVLSWSDNLCCGAVEVDVEAYDAIRAAWQALDVDLLETHP